MERVREIEQLLKLEISLNKYFMTWSRAERFFIRSEWKVCYQIISDVPIGLEAVGAAIRRFSVEAKKYSEKKNAFFLSSEN